MMYTKTQAAYIMTVNKLFDTCKKGYFWTFTFIDVMPDWWYPRHWNLFCAALGNLYGGFIPGVRVVEVHPNGHGLHYHAIFGVRVSVHLVRRVAKRFGIGRVFVEPCTRGTGLYLAKYLTKKNPLYSGMRRWGTIGGFEPVRVRDIEVDSIFHRNLRKLGGGRQKNFRFVNAVKIESEIYGDLRHWPKGRKSEIVLSDGVLPRERPSFTIVKKATKEEKDEIIRNYRERVRAPESTQNSRCASAAACSA